MIRIIYFLTALSILGILSSCNTGNGDIAYEPLEAAADAGVTHQIIHGFGASNAWMSPPSDSSTAGKIITELYSRTEGIGLSIFRTRIPFRENEGDYRDGFLISDEAGEYIHEERGGVKYFAFNWNAWEISHTKKTLGYISSLGEDGPEDLKIMATPWTPPNNWKEGYPDPRLPAYGGILSPEHYTDYADILADFVRGYENELGHPLYALSIQNEPDYVPSTYESCGWSADQIRRFLPVLGSRLALKGIGDSVNIVAAESMHFTEQMVAPSLNDPEASRVIDIVGTHQYNHDETWNTGAKKLKLVESSEKALWQTEVSSGDANDSSIQDGLYWAKVIHNDLTIAEVNAFLYWWLWSGSDSKGALVTMSSGSPVYNKRLYTMGQFSRFIRPGWTRIESEEKPMVGVSISAFTNRESGELAVVIVNEQKKGFSLKYSIEGITKIGELESRVTDAERDLEEGSRPQSIGSGFEQKIAPRSVTTVFGEYTP